MSKTSLVVLEHKRTALPDGRVVEAVSVDLKDQILYHWQCVCKPEDKHDHQPHIDRIAAGLINRQEVLPPIAALVGKEVHGATVTDANIQIRGPQSWRLYVAWTEANGLHREYSQDYDDPIKTPSAESILAVVTKEVLAGAARLEAAKKMENFEDPTV